MHSSIALNQTGTRLNNLGVKIKARRKSKKNFVMPTLLFLVLSGLIVRSTIFQRSRSAEEFVSIDIYAMIDIGFVLLSILLILYSQRLRKILNKLKSTSAYYFILYYFISLLSALWSPLPPFSAYRAIEFLSQFLGIFIAISYFTNKRDAEKRVLFFSLLSLIFSALPHFINAGFTISFVAWHTNIYTASAAMIFCYTFGEYPSAKGRRKFQFKIIIVISLFFLIIGTSTASYVATIIGIIVISIYYRNKALLLLVLFFSVLVFASNEMADYATQGLFFGKQESRVASLSGREVLWLDYWNMFSEKPVIGYGFAVGARIAARATTNPHNSLIAAALGTGAIGVLVFTVFLLKLVSEFKQNYLKKLKRNPGVVAALSAGIVNSFSMPLIGHQWAMSPSFIFTCFLAYFIFIHQKSKRQKRSAHLHTKLAKTG